SNAYTAADYLIHDWHHVVAGSDPSTDSFQIYIDGELSAESALSPTFDDEGYGFQLGRLHVLRYPEDSQPLSGAIDEVSIYRRPLGEAKRLSGNKSYKDAQEF
ncbi:MAG: hypothetical protein ACI9MB_002027, partial [Verrucomicrobiales bacterium]